ncbi:kinase-like domain-containing protein [Crucibulum laeve]|uniref:non-specific serine/threonine protein kinase n=1 Tax=Crucibulum laeve TaxID=68775 RepID=A0A5C3LZ33_9AGAR|nr:kinase-like domain-containing protein [Crucibulum laeve]
MKLETIKASFKRKPLSPSSSSSSSSLSPSTPSSSPDTRIPTKVKKSKNAPQFSPLSPSDRYPSSTSSSYLAAADISERTNPPSELSSSQDTQRVKFASKIQNMKRSFKFSYRRGKNSTPSSISSSRFSTPSYHRIDPDDLPAYESISDAIHHPSVLDAHKPIRYDLTTPPPAPRKKIYTNTRAPASPKSPSPLPKSSISSSAASPELSTYVCPSQHTLSPIAPAFASTPISLSPPSKLSATSTARFSKRVLISSKSAKVPSKPPTSTSSKPLPALPASFFPPSPPPYEVVDVIPRICAGIVDIYDFTCLKVLGVGATGEVYLVDDKVSRNRMALKVIRKSKALGDTPSTTVRFILREQRILRKMADSPWALNLLASWSDWDQFYFATEFHPTNLESEIIRCGKFDPDRVRFYVCELVVALSALHKRGIIHRDIKAANILIHRNGHLVLADFGLAKDFEQEPSFAERVYQPYWPYLPTDTVSQNTRKRHPTHLTFVAYKSCGSELEASPEIFTGSPYAFGVDFWGVAVVGYAMLTGRVPFREGPGFRPVCEQIVKEPHAWYKYDNVDEITRDFFDRMLAKDPSKRLFVDCGMQEHPYFAGIDWVAIEERRVRVPWIPGPKASHVFQTGCAVVTPGEPYAGRPDPYPQFQFTSDLMMTIPPPPGLFRREDEVTEEKAEDQQVAYDPQPTLQVGPSHPGLLAPNEPRRTRLLTHQDLIPDSSRIEEDQAQAQAHHNQHNEDSSLPYTLNMAETNISSSSSSYPRTPRKEAHIKPLGLERTYPACDISFSEASFLGISFDSSNEGTSSSCSPTSPILARSTQHHVINGTDLRFKLKMWWKTLFGQKPRPQSKAQYRRTILF